MSGAPAPKAPRSGPCSIWVAQLHEAETVAGLLVEFRDWWGRAWPSANAFHAGVERLMEGRDADFLLGAPDEDSPPSGVCQLRYRFGVWMAAEDAWLEDVFVREAARGAGLGSALIEAAIERARERGCRRVELDVNSANHGARALYERFGFTAWSDPPGGENLLMRLRLPEPP